jgi:hypothetical protein
LILGIEEDEREMGWGVMMDGGWWRGDMVDDFVLERDGRTMLLGHFVGWSARHEEKLLECLHIE